jgi:hypothetical protein
MEGRFSAKKKSAVCHSADFSSKFFASHREAQKKTQKKRRPRVFFDGFSGVGVFWLFFGDFGRFWRIFTLFS